MTLRRRLLWPLVPVYAAGLAVTRRMAESRRRQRPLERPVLSVGSVSAGGAGKTPLVLALAETMQAREYDVRILTRGYKRSSRVVERVDPEGDPERFGDEPMLLAQRSAVPVYVGADRYEAGRLAESSPGTGLLVHLLDDGFQHRRLARDLDLVLLTKKDVTDLLLPAGDLREPLTALREADVIVLREEEAESLMKFLSLMTQESGTPVVWQIRRSLSFETTAGSRPVRPLAFCGIARPESFFGMVLQRMGSCGRVTFPDHHRYDEAAIGRLLREAKRQAADGFVTTEKDAVKLRPEMRRRLGAIGPLLIARLTVSFVDERSVMEELIGMVPRLDRRRVGRR